MKKILLYFLPCLALISGCAGMTFFLMSIFSDKFLFLEFNSLVRCALILSTSSIFLSIISVCFLQVNRHEALILFIASAGILTMNSVLIIIILGFIAFYFIRKLKKRSLILLTLSVAVLISLPPIIFINILNMNVKSREVARRNNTLMYQLEVVYDVAQRYAAANGGYLPQADGWCDTLMEFDNTLKEENFKHPKIPGHIIAYNSNIAGMLFDKLQYDTIIFFEARGDMNLVGSQELINRLDTQIADIILANRELETYWVVQKGIKLYNNEFRSGNWISTIQNTDKSAKQSE